METIKDEINSFSPEEFRLARSRRNLEKVIVEATEETYERGYMTEKTKQNLGDTLKHFFTEIITSIKKFIDDVHIRIDSAIREKQVFARLKLLEKKLESEKEAGAKKVSMMDVWKYQKIYLEAEKDLWLMAKRFAKTQYHSIERLDEDLDDFNNDLAYYEEKLTEIENKKIEVPIKKAINFVQSELNKDTAIIKTLNESITRVKEMEHEATTLSARRLVLGDDVIPKHVGLIKRAAIAISTFVKKKVVKFITTMVFIFA